MEKLLAAKEECFGYYPMGDSFRCALLCVDVHECELLTAQRGRSDYNLFEFVCPECGGNCISEEIEILANVGCTLSGSFDPLDFEHYKLQSADPVEYEHPNKTSYRCDNCGYELPVWDRRSLRTWLCKNAMNVKGE